MPLSLLFRIDVRRTTAIFFSRVSNTVIGKHASRWCCLLFVFGQNFVAGFVIPLAGSSLFK